MALLEWRDEFEIGVEEVDFEHRELFKLINDIYGATSADLAGTADVLGRIHSAISAHFALEEKVMREAGYASFEAHKADHEDLLDDLRQIMDGFDEGVFTPGSELDSILANWFGHHFRTHDAQLHRALGARS